MCQFSDRDSEIDGLGELMPNRRGPTSRSVIQQKRIGMYRPSSKVAALIRNLESDGEAAAQAGQVKPKRYVDNPVCT